MNCPLWAKAVAAWEQRAAPLIQRAYEMRRAAAAADDLHHQQKTQVRGSYRPDADWWREKAKWAMQVGECTRVAEELRSAVVAAGVPRYAFQLCGARYGPSHEGSIDPSRILCIPFIHSDVVRNFAADPAWVFLGHAPVRTENTLNHMVGMPRGPDGAQWAINDRSVLLVYDGQRGVFIDECVFSERGWAGTRPLAETLRAFILFRHASQPRPRGCLRFRRNGQGRAVRGAKGARGPAHPYQLGGV